MSAKPLLWIGAYVLATKYSDGDPKDHWCIGFYDGKLREDRHLVRDAAGELFRANGFRRVQRITARRGSWLLEHARDIELSGRSLWMWVRAPYNSLDGLKVS